MDVFLTHKTNQSEPAPSLVLDGRSVPEIFLKRVELMPKQRVFLVKTDGVYRPQCWEEIDRKMLGAFASLQALGIGKGDRVAILSNSRPEWAIADLAIQSLGAVTVPIYHSSDAEDTAFILEHSESKLVFAEDASQVAKLETVFARLERRLPVVSFETEPFSRFCNAIQPASEADRRARIESIRPSDLATIVYTSGTTGRPKGAQLLHSCLTAESRSVAQEFELSTEDLLLTFLPFAHVLGRVESLVPIVSGVPLAFAENVSSVTSNILEVKPTILISVPRIYEKIYAKILSEIETSGDLKKRLFQWAVTTGRDRARRLSLKQSIPLSLQVKYRAADRLVFSKIREKLGGRIRFTVSGGAPLAPELCEFFHACGVKIMEGYGLTETTAAIAVNRPTEYRFATVGRPLAGSEFKIAEDGEILVRGPVVFSGYFNDEAATHDALSEDGWFRTGDIGEFDEKGFLKITDRKKELIVTSGGKNIAPQKLENLIKQIPLVSQALVYGDKQKYLVALVTLSEGDVKKWLRDKSLGDLTDSGDCPRELQDRIEEGIRELNKGLASYETIKKFKILPRDFTLEAGEMTPSLKLKRKVIAQRYQTDLEALYR